MVFSRFIKKVTCEKNVIIFIGIIAFCSYLIFNYAVPFYYYSHDLGGIDSGRGHIGYIQYILDNTSLPIFSINPMKIWSFYNPPLHYVLSALWIKGSLFFTVSLKTGFEWLQVLTSVYMGFALFFFYKLLFLLKIKHKILCWTYFCFNPMLFFLSSCLNNDSLLFVISIATFYYGLKWYYKPTLKTMVKAAIFTGLGFMTKFSAVVILFILAFVFVLRFFYNKNERKSYVYQLLIYLLILIPVGGWYYGYAYIKWDIPINYVQRPKYTKLSHYYKENFYLRLTHAEWDHIYAPTNKELSILPLDKCDLNMFALGLKRSVFGYKNYEKKKILNIIAPYLFYSSVFFFFSICFCLFWYILYWPVSKMKMPDLVLVSYVILLLIFYVYFNYCYPYHWTAQFRYIPMFFVCAPLLWEKFLNDRNIIFYLLPLLIAFTSLGFWMTLSYQRLFGG